MKNFSLDDGLHIFDIHDASRFGISRQQIRILVCLSTAVIIILYNIIIIIIVNVSQKRIHKSKDNSKVSLDALQMLHESSYGLVAVLGMKESRRILSWVDLHCAVDTIEKIDFLGKLLRYHLLASKNGSKRLLAKGFSPDSWMDWVIWSMMGATSAVEQRTRPIVPLLIRIIHRLCSCHVEGMVWPACIIDVLILSALDNDVPSRQKGLVTRNVAAQLRGHLLLMGIIRPVRCYELEGIECYTVTNIRSWDNNASTKLSYDSEQEASWRTRFVNAIEGLAFPPQNDEFRQTVQPASMSERCVTHAILPKILTRLQCGQVAYKCLCDPFGAYCRLLRRPKSHENAFRQDTLSFLPSNLLHEQDDYRLILLDAQVLWKEKCCKEISKCQAGHLSQPFKRVGLALINSPRYKMISFRCIEEAHSLQTTCLVQALKQVMNGIQYTALVLWTIGKPNSGAEKKAMTRERVLSWNLFSLHAKLRSISLTKEFYFEWVNTIKSILSETAWSKNCDVQEGHRRLSLAMSCLDSVYAELQEISALLQTFQEEPLLVTETLR